MPVFDKKKNIVVYPHNKTLGDEPFFICKKKVVPFLLRNEGLKILAPDRTLLLR
jgi:hypothetical protein